MTQPDDDIRNIRARSSKLMASLKRQQKRSQTQPHPSDKEPNEDEIADDLARMMESRLVQEDDGE